MKKSLILVAVAAFALIISACKKEDDKTTPADIDCTTVTYSGTIAPLVASSCGGGSCHGSGSSNGDYTTYAALKADADNGKLRSELIDRQTMPRGSSSSATQLGQWECWLNDGAPNN